MNIDIKFLCKQLLITYRSLTWCLNIMGPKTPQNPLLTPTGQSWSDPAQEWGPWSPFILCAKAQYPRSVLGSSRGHDSVPWVGCFGGREDSPHTIPSRSFWVHFLPQHQKGGQGGCSFRIRFLTFSPQWLQVTVDLKVNIPRSCSSRIWQITQTLWASASPSKNKTNVNYSDRLIGQLGGNADKLPDTWQLIGDQSVPLIKILK